MTGVQTCALPIHGATVGGGSDDAVDGVGSEDDQVGTGKCL